MSDDYDPPLVHLPGTKLTPEVVLHRTLNKLSHIKSVVVIIKWNDDSFDTDHSLQSVSDLCVSARVLDRMVDRSVFREDETLIYQPRTPDPA